MPKIESGFYSHPKILKAGNAAVGLWVRALSYCWDHKTEGRIPLSFLKGVLKTAERCVLAGLFDRDGDSYKVHDYLGHNYSKTQREKFAASRKPGGLARHQHDASKMLEPIQHIGQTVIGNGDEKIRASTSTSTSSFPSLSPPNRQYKALEGVNLGGLVKSVPPVSPTGMRIEAGRRHLRQVKRSEL